MKRVGRVEIPQEAFLAVLKVSGKRFQHVVIEIARRLPQLVQKPCLGDARMPQIGERELADAEIPIWMSGPFHIQLVSKIEGRLYVLALQLIHNHAIVDAVDRHVTVIEPVPALANVGQRHWLYATVFLCQQEIRQSLLVIRIYFHQDDVLGIAVAYDRLA